MAMSKISRAKRIFKVNPAVLPFFLRNPLTYWLMEHAFSLNRLETIYQDGVAVGNYSNFCQVIMDVMGIRCKVSAEDVAKIPKEGPVVVVANHPYGGIEGIALAAFLASVRTDVKVMANYMLQRIPETRDIFILVDPFGTSGSAKRNIRPLLASMRHLQQTKGLLGIFPSGEVSSIDLKARRVRDPAWSPTVATLIRKSKATVLPIYFDGRNGALFQMMGLIHPLLRTAMLPKMFVDRRNTELEMRIGIPLAPGELAKYETDEELINYLRLRTYALEGRDDEADGKEHPLFSLKKLSLPFFGKRRKAPGPQAAIVTPVPPDVVAREIAGLPKEALLLASGDMEVYMAPGTMLPKVLQDIGRLREVTFRGVGEGTGRSTDLDTFDIHYHHLFTWNRVKQEIVGAYRLGLADKIIQSYGIAGLYTHTLFKFDHRLIDQLQPCVEMGRSFVRPEYQRSFSSLLLLWKGIGAFLARYPYYVTLFGPVSISNEYRDHSRHLMLRSLSLSNFANDLAHLVKPRNPPRRKVKAEWNLETFNPYISDVDNVSAIVQDIEEDKKGIPILLRQYLKLGGRLLAFNLDEDFSSVVDGLIAIDVRKTDPRTRAKYMGEEADAKFREYHGL